MSRPTPTPTILTSWYILEFMVGPTRYRLWENDAELSNPDATPTLTRRAESGIWHPVPPTEAPTIIQAVRTLFEGDPS